MSAVLLIAVLAFAVVRPCGWPEAVVAVPASVLVVAFGLIPWREAWAELLTLTPVVGFLAVVLVLAQLADDEGLFRAAGTVMAQTSAGRSNRLLAQVFAVAAVTTAVLSLDATVVLLTPVVLVTTARLKVRHKPYLYACAHMANSASLLLPMSNLTNLLAFAAVKVSFTRFAALIATPWLVVIGVEFLMFRTFFARDLQHGAVSESRLTRPQVPAFTVVVLALTLAGFAVAPLFGVQSGWAGLAGVVVLGARAVRRRHTTFNGIARSVNAPFLAFVLALGIVVRAVVDNGFAGAMSRLVPSGPTTLVSLLLIAATAAVLSNVVNNLPALLVLPLVAHGDTGPVLAALIGVNIGPNLTYVGSLATLLWRRTLRQRAYQTSLGEFSMLGLLTVPAALIGAVLALSASLHLIGS